MHTTYDVPEYFISPFYKQTVERLENVLLDGKKPKSFIEFQVDDLRKFIQNELMNFVTTFKKVMLAMDFRTPLNFMMLPKDFERFYSVFYHA